MTKTPTNKTGATREPTPRTRRAAPEVEATAPETGNAPRETKLAILIRLLAREDGATIAELSEATGWKTHSVRGALAGTLRKKGIEVTSGVSDGVRRYRSGATS